jgi:cytoskeletal protein CcmA (bactofilin family)
VNSLHETRITIISEGTRIEGEITFDQVTRVHGTLIGKIKAKEGSTLILCETAVVEGNIEADTLIIDGYVQGKIEAKNRVVISRTGRVIGTIKTSSLQLEFGSYFEGRCAMEKQMIGASPSPNPTHSLS